jgi:hypothetical protein
MTGFKFIPAKPVVVEKAFNKALFACAEQILTDCNTYVKHLEGALEDSSQHAVRSTTLVLTWNTPYAKKQWYTGKPSDTSLRFHPKASIMWAIKAQDEYGKDWQKILQKGFTNNL